MALHRVPLSVQKASDLRLGIWMLTGWKPPFTMSVEEAQALAYQVFIGKIKPPENSESEEQEEKATAPAPLEEPDIQPPEPEDNDNPEEDLSEF